MIGVFTIFICLHIYFKILGYFRVDAKSFLYAAYGMRYLWHFSIFYQYIQIYQIVLHTIFFCSNRTPCISAVYLLLVGNSTTIELRLFVFLIGHASLNNNDVSTVWGSINCIKNPHRRLHFLRFDCPQMLLTVKKEGNWVFLKVGVIKWACFRV